MKEISKPRKFYDHTIYQKITHIERLNVIYSRVIHQLSLNEISAELNLKYNTVRNILNAYKNSGRTNKKKYIRKTPMGEPDPPKKKLQSINSAFKGWSDLQTDFIPAEEPVAEKPGAKKDPKRCPIKLYVC